MLSLDDVFGAGAKALRGALDAFPDPAGILAAERGADGAIEELIVLFGNRAAEGLLGIDLGSGPLRLTEIAPTVRDDGVFDLFCGVIETGEPWLGDRPFDAVAGTNRLAGTYQIRAVRMGDGVLFLVRDVSALRAFEAEVERVTAIVQNTDDAIVGADPEGRVTHWNPGAERMFGYSSEEIMGTPMARLVRPEDRAPQAARFEELLAGRRIDRIEARWVHSDRTLIDVIITASPMVVRDGTVIGASAVVHDVTARRRVESELERSNAELRRFADVAAHDIREPLAAIARFAELLRRRRRDRARRARRGGAGLHRDERRAGAPPGRWAARVRPGRPRRAGAERSRSRRARAPAAADALGDARRARARGSRSASSRSFSPTPTSSRASSRT